MPKNETEASVELFAETIDAEARYACARKALLDALQTYLAEQDIHNVPAAFDSDESCLCTIPRSPRAEGCLRFCPPQKGTSLTRALCDQIFTMAMHWTQATNFSQTATHAVDFGTGIPSGIGPLKALKPEHGVRVIVVGDKSKSVAELFDAPAGLCHAQKPDWLRRVEYSPPDKPHEYAESFFKTYPALLTSSFPPPRKRRTSLRSARSRGLCCS